MIGRLTQPRAEPTACATLVITAAPSHASSRIRPGVGQFALLHRPSGQRVAAADEPEALHHLAQQLAWFDDNATDPRYLADPANAGARESLRELLQQWCAAESDYAPHATLLAAAHSLRCRPMDR